MTGRERFCRVMEFQSVDRVPNYELGIWQQTRDRWESEGAPLDNVYLNWFEGEKYLGIDRRGFANVVTGLHPPYDDEVLSEDERYIIARNWAGVVTKALKEGTVRGMRMSMDTYLEFPVTDRESFRRFTSTRYNPGSITRYPQWWDEWVRIWATRDYPLCLLNNGSFGLYSGLRTWVGTENLSYMFYDDPALIDEMLEFMTDFMLQVVEKALGEVQFDYFNFFEDFAGKNTPLLSPQMFRRFFLPHYRRIIDRLRKAGIKYFWLDSDGTADPLIPAMIEAGVTCLWPLEVASGMDPVGIREKYGKDLALAGGIDKRELAKGRKAIEAELLARIPPMLESGGGYLPHVDHTVPPDVPFDDFLYYLEVKQKLLSGG